MLEEMVRLFSDVMKRERISSWRVSLLFLSLVGMLLDENDMSSDILFLTEPFFVGQKLVCSSSYLVIRDDVLQHEWDWND